MLVARALCNLDVVWETPQAARWLECVELLAAQPADALASLAEACASLLVNAVLVLPVSELAGFRERVLSRSPHCSDAHVRLLHARLKQ